MYTDDDAEMQARIRQALKNQLVSTYGSDYLSPEACRERAAQLRSQYEAEQLQLDQQELRVSASGGSVKQTDYRSFEDRPQELVNSRTRFGARDRQLGKFESGVLPREAVSAAYLTKASSAEAKSQATTYKDEISKPGQLRVQQQQQQQNQQELRRWKQPQWEGPVGPVQK